MVFLAGHIVVTLSALACTRVVARSTADKNPTGLDDGVLSLTQTTPAAKTLRQKTTPRNKVRISDRNPTKIHEDVNFSLTTRNGSHKDAIQLKTLSNLADYDNAKTNLTISQTSGKTTLHSDSVSSKTNHRSRRIRRASMEADNEYIHFTYFSDWRVLVAISVAEVIVYVITVSIVLVRHSRQRNQIGSVRDGAMTSRYQFTL